MQGSLCWHEKARRVGASPLQDMGLGWVLVFRAAWPCSPSLCWAGAAGGWESRVWGPWAHHLCAPEAPLLLVGASGTRRWERLFSRSRWVGGQVAVLSLEHPGQCPCRPPSCPGPHGTTLEQTEPLGIGLPMPLGSELEPFVLLCPGRGPSPSWSRMGHAASGGPCFCSCWGVGASGRCLCPQGPLLLMALLLPRPLSWVRGRW